MPNRDGTGPNGQGPRTGRQLGNCKNTKPIVGRGLGPCGRGLGKRLGRRFLEEKEFKEPNTSNN